MQIIELIYGLIPYSIHKNIVSWKCKYKKQDPLLTKNHLALYPYNLDINKVVKDDLDKCVAFLPYCAKPMGEYQCPLSDSINKRKNQKCIQLSGGKCDVACSLGEMVSVLRKHGFTKEQIFIVDTDSNLFPWLKQKKEEGFEYILPGVACNYSVSYAISYIGKKLGYKGCIAFVDDYCPEDKENGVCKCMNDYMGMDGVDKGKRTKIHKETIIIVDAILSGNYYYGEYVACESCDENKIASST